jgi:hypothetical protein
LHQGLFLSAEDYPSRRIFRIRYAGSEGQASLRLMLFLEELDHYQVRTADPVGRGLWSVEVEGTEIHIVDRRRKLQCRAGELGSLPRIGPVQLPLEAFPAVLLGRLPRGLQPSSAGVDALGRLDFRDSQERRWSVVTRGNSITRWTMWEGEVPMLWWLRGDRDAVLSHRQGQLRWRQVVEEPLRQAMPPLEVPTGARLVPCKELELLRFDRLGDDL